MISILPSEIICEICRFLSIQKVLQFASTCKNLQHVIILEKNLFWSNYVTTDLNTRISVRDYVATKIDGVQPTFTVEVDVLAIQQEYQILFGSVKYFLKDIDYKSFRKTLRLSTEFTLAITLFPIGYGPNTSLDAIQQRFEKQADMEYYREGADHFEYNSKQIPLESTRTDVKKCFDAFLNGYDGFNFKYQNNKWSVLTYLKIRDLGGILQRLELSDCILCEWDWSASYELHGEQKLIRILSLVTKDIGIAISFDVHSTHM
jgi:hypothetical protein